MAAHCCRVSPGHGDAGSSRGHAVHGPGCGIIDRTLIRRGQQARQGRTSVRNYAPAFNSADKAVQIMRIWSIVVLHLLNLIRF